MAKTIRDMINQYSKNRYAFSSFLNVAQTDDFLASIREYGNVPYSLFGGKENCERLMFRIGDVESLGYEEPFPISVLKVAPKSSKFSDALTHRDFLGALLNLGIERDTIGDIYIEDNVGYIFCEDKICNYIIDNLTRIKHTSVDCCLIEKMPELESATPEELIVQVSSNRIDSIIAKAYRLSRNDALSLVESKKVFVNSRLCENSSLVLKQDDVVSIRGYGRLKLVGENGISKKGKLNLKISITK